MWTIKHVELVVNKITKCYFIYSKKVITIVLKLKLFEINDNKL